MGKRQSLEKEIESLDKDINILFMSLGAQRRIKGKKLDELRQLVYKIKPGDKVEYKGKKYMLTELTQYYPVGRGIKKDGKLNDRGTILSHYYKDNNLVEIPGWKIKRK